ncbi:DUF2599 domain-containing protein [Antrihabitans cavernicola]|uniref:DUF2599 domain-containing protein n=2 Tax=Antrihabitans cavernicola TaxID=2495913 RepID=A0A5A7SE48_9NOCA|nr:DUF2599 domain-containing protein [Spelaeibacter cavernicola]
MGTVAAVLAAMSLVTGCGAGSATESAPPTATTTAKPLPPTTPAPAVDHYAGAPLIDHVTWTQTDKGDQLQVIPTPAGRADTFPTAGDRAWSEVIAAEPSADTPGMHDQFFCHWVYARLVQPDKPSWNLEPWRPNVGYQATVAAQCNPGGAEE